MDFVGKIKSTFSLLGKSVKRFPQTIFFCIATAVVLMILTHNVYWGNAQKVNIKLMLSLTLMIPLFTSINLFFERKSSNLIVKSLINILGLVIGYLTYTLLLKDLNAFQNIMGYFLLFLFFVLTFFYVPYNNKRQDYENYILKLITNFIISIVYTFVLMLGIFAIIFTIDKLFGVNMRREIYSDIFIVLFVIFAPTYFLSKHPTQDDILISYYPIFIKILMSYIILPLLTIYSLILYVYFGKIIITRVWPIGIVSNLVLWSVLVGIISLFFISPLTQDNRWPKTFKKWYPMLSLPLLIMMFISIGIRIKAYGITESRYAVLVLGIWEFAIMLYYIISKSHRNVILPISLSLIILISGFSPLSAFNVSKISQNSRIQALFNKYNMIENNTIVKANVTPDNKDIRDIRSIIDYFQSYHKVSDIKHMPRNFSYDKAKFIFGFDLYAGGYDYNINRYYHIELNEAAPINLEGYKYLLGTSAYYYPSKAAISKETVRHEFNSTTKILKIYKGDLELYTKDLSPILTKLVDKHISQSNFGSDSSNITNPEDLSFKDFNDKIDLKIIFRNINGERNTETNTLNSTNVAMYILYNLK